MALLAVGSLLALGAVAHASVAAVDTVLYGKADTQIQFVICFDAADPDAQNIELGSETMEFEWTARDAAGTVIGTDRSPAPGVRYLGFGTCRFGYVQAYALNDLTPGATYAIETRATLTAPSGAEQVLTDVLTVTTTGGCPIDAPVENPPRYTYLHAVVDDDNRVTMVHSIAPGTILLPPWSSVRYIPTYYGWPGKQYAGIGYIYDPETDNFAPPLPAGVEMLEADLLGLAGLSGCDGAPGTEVDLEIAPASQDNCAVVDGGVQGFAPGACAVEMTIRRAARASRSTRARTVTAVAIVRGSSSRPIGTNPNRTVRPPSPAQSQNGSPGSAAGATAGAIAWSTRSADRTATARFRAVRGATYRIRAVLPGSPTRRGSCRVRTGSAMCTIALGATGRWRVTVTPIVKGIAGTPIRTRIEIV